MMKSLLSFQILNKLHNKGVIANSLILFYNEV